jgi:Family of unknown function (DUF6220)
VVGPSLTGMSSSSTTTTTPPGYRAVTTQVMRYLSMAGATLALAQFALAGYGAFNSVNGHGTKYGAHEAVGNIVALVSILVLVAALIARPRRGTVWLALVVFVLSGLLQGQLAGLAKDHGAWIGSLHGLNGALILIVFGLLSRKVSVASAS